MSFKAGTDTEYTIVSMTVIFDDVKRFLPLVTHFSTNLFCKEFSIT